MPVERTVIKFVWAKGEEPVWILQAAASKEEPMKREKKKRQISWKRIAAIDSIGTTAIVAFSAALIVWIVRSSYTKPIQKETTATS